MGNQASSSQNVSTQPMHPAKILFKPISDSSGGSIVLKDNLSICKTVKTEGLSSDSLQGEKCISTNATNESCTTMESKLDDGKIPTLFQWKEGGKVVYMSGSFCNWNQKFLMSKVNNYFEVTLDLPRGVHQYKFIVDEYWRFSRHHPTCSDMKGNINNLIDNSNYQSKKAQEAAALNDVAKANKKSTNANVNVNVTTSESSSRGAVVVGCNMSQACTINDYHCNVNVIKEIQYDAVPCPKNYKESFSMSMAGKLQSSSASGFFVAKASQVCGNNSYEAIPVVPHVHVNHLLVSQNNNFEKINDIAGASEVIVSSLTQRVRNKMLTFVYYSPTQLNN